MALYIPFNSCDERQTTQILAQEDRNLEKTLAWTSPPQGKSTFLKDVEPYLNFFLHNGPAAKGRLEEGMSV